MKENEEVMFTDDKVSSTPISTECNVQQDEDKSADNKLHARSVYFGMLTGLIIGLVSSAITMLISAGAIRATNMDEPETVVSPVVQEDNTLKQSFSTYIGTVSGTKYYEDEDGSVSYVVIDGCFFEVDKPIREEFEQLIGKVVQLTISRNQQGEQVDEFLSYKVIE